MEQRQKPNYILPKRLLDQKDMMKKLSELHEKDQQRFHQFKRKMRFQGPIEKMKTEYERLENYHT